MDSGKCSSSTRQDCGLEVLIRTPYIEEGLIKVGWDLKDEEGLCWRPAEVMLLNLPNAMLGPFNKGSSCCGDRLTIKLFFLLLHNCNFAPVMNQGVTI